MILGVSVLPIRLISPEFQVSLLGWEAGLQNSGEQTELETKSIQDPEVKCMVRNHPLGL